MKILHAISTTAFAGSERYVAELAAQQSRDHQVAVLIRRTSRDTLTGTDIADVLSPAVTMIRAGRAGYGVALMDAVRRFAPDVLHTHLGKASMRARVLPLGGVPMVATLHNRFSGRVYGAHDGLICIARWQQEELAGVAAERAQVVHNWTCAQGGCADHRQALRAQWGVEPGAFVFGAAGRLVPHKGFDLLIRAFEQADIPGARLVIFGDGPMREPLRLRAGQRVVFPGYSRCLPQDLAGLDAFVLPSHREPFGLVLLEAMANGLPVLATDAGGVPDILGAGSAALVPPCDVDAMAAGLRRLHGASRVTWDLDSFRLPEAAARIEQVYNAVIKAKREARPDVALWRRGLASRRRPAVDGVP